MEKINNFFKNKVNVFATIIILAALIVGGYKTVTVANIDAVCVLDFAKYDILTDKTETGCTDISWGAWRTEGDKDVRDGVGTKSIITYAKKEIVSQKQEVKMNSHVAARDTASGKCAGFYGGVKHWRDHDYQSQWLPVQERNQEVFLGYKKDDTLKDGGDGVVVFRTNLICQVQEKVDSKCGSDDNCDTTLCDYGDDNCNGICEEGEKCAAGCKLGEACDTGDKGDDNGDGTCEKGELCDTGCKLGETCDAGDQRDDNGDGTCEKGESCDTGCKLGDSCKIGDRGDDNGDGTCEEGEMCSTDDLTGGTNDDLTQAQLCALNPASCKDGQQPAQGNIDSEVAWSTDKAYWHTDFSKVIKLKSKNDKIYIKDKIQVGSTCIQDDGKKSFLDLFNVNFPATDGRDASWLSQSNEKTLGNSFLMDLQTTNNAPVGKVFKQNVNVGYCGKAADNTKTLNVQLVDIKQNEI